MHDYLWQFSFLLHNAKYYNRISKLVTEKFLKAHRKKDTLNIEEKDKDGS